MKTKLKMPSSDLSLHIDKKSLLYLVLFITIACILAYSEFFSGQKLYLFDGYDNDTKTSYLMRYSALANKILEGDLTSYDFTLGGGFDIFSSQANITDPFLVIILIFAAIGGISAVPYSLFIMFLAKVFCAGLVCYCFLSAFRFSEKAKIFTSFAYSLCGYMTCWSPHSFLVTGLILLPVVLLFLEMSFREKRYLIGFSIAIAANLCISIYLAFGIVLLTICYGIIRFYMINMRISWSSVKEQLLPIIGAGIIGFLVSAVIFLPSAYALLFSSDRLETDATLLERFNSFGMEQYYARFGEFLPGQFFTINNGFPGGNIPIFFSALFVVLIPQYIAYLFTREERRIKIIGILTIIFTLVFILSPYLEVVANALNTIKSSLRFTYLLMPLYALMMAYMLTLILRKEFFNRKVMYGSIIALIVLLMFYLFDRNYWASTSSFSSKMALIVGIAVSVCFGILLLGRGKLRILKSERVVTFIIAILLIGNMSIDAWVIMHNRASNTTEQISDLYNSGAIQAVQYIDEREDEFYRTEKADYSVSQYGEAGVLNYNGLSIYSSASNQYLSEFYTKLWRPMLIKGNTMEQTYVYNPLNNNQMESLLNLKYILTKTNDFDPINYQPIAQFGEYTVLENLNAQSLGIFYNKVISEEEFEKLSPMQQRLVLYEAMVVNDEEDVAYSSGQELSLYKLLVDSENLNNTISYVAKNSTNQQEIENEQIFRSFIIPLNEGSTQGLMTFALDRAVYLNSVPGDLYLTMDIDVCATEGMEDKIVEEGTEYWLNIYFDCGNGYQFQTEVRFPLNAKQSNPVLVNVPHNAQSMMFEFAALDTDLQPVNTAFTGMKVSNMNLITPGKVAFPETGYADFKATKKSDKIEGSVIANEDGYLMLSIPYSEGWKIYVDGKEASVMRADYGFMGIEISQGSHTIALFYDSPFIKEGFWISIVGIGGLVLFYIFYIKKSIIRRK